MDRSRQPTHRQLQRGGARCINWKWEGEEKERQSVHVRAYISPCFAVLSYMAVLFLFWQTLCNLEEDPDSWTSLAERNWGTAVLLRLPSKSIMDGPNG